MYVRNTLSNIYITYPWCINLPFNWLSHPNFAKLFFYGKTFQFWLSRQQFQCQKRRWCICIYVFNYLWLQVIQSCYCVWCHTSEFGDYTMVYSVWNLFFRENQRKFKEFYSLLNIQRKCANHGHNTQYCIIILKAPLLVGRFWLYPLILLSKNRCSPPLPNSHSPRKKEKKS